MRRALAVLLLMSALAAVATACGNGAGAKPDDKRLTVVAFKGGGTELAGLPELNAKFQKEHPDLKLEFKYVSPDYDTYNNSRLAAGDAADVLMIDRQKMVKWSKQGYLADLSDQPWVDRMNPDLKYFNTMNGKTYQLNGENIAIGFYANLDLLRQAGIQQVPQTWPDLISDLQILKAKKINGFMLPNKGGWTGEQLALLLAANLVDKSWAQDYDGGKASFAPAWNPVVDRIKELFSTGTVDPKLMLGLDPNNDGVPQFKAGKWAFLINGAWALSDIAKNASFKFSFNAFPGGATGTAPKLATFVGAGWGVNSHAKNPAAAKQYVEFLSRPENATVVLKAEAAFSPLKDVESPAVAAAKPALEAYTSGHSMPSPAQVLNFANAETELQKGIELAFADPARPTSSVLSSLESQIPRTPLS